MIQNRKGGRQPHHTIAIEIAVFIAETIATGCKVDAAVAAASSRFATPERTVWRAWSDHKFSGLVRPLWETSHAAN